MIYREKIQSKSGEWIPLFLDSHPMFSKYNVQKEVEIFSKNINENFIIILGIGAAYHIKFLAKKLPEAKIIAVEADKESLDFCRTFESTSELEKNKNIIFCSADELEHFLKSYLPAVYGNLCVSSYKSWENENKILCEKILCQIKKFIETLKADYSVQAHFGKIWTRNIFLNYKILNFSKPLKNLNPDKTAAVIGAGPSLDNCIEILKERRNFYFIISSDTAFSALLKNKIFPDCVISVDGQHISSSHFFSIPKDCEYKIHFIFDLCANPESVKLVLNKNQNFEFTKNKNPLENILSGTENLLELESDGTVTIAAGDWARLAGFKKIEFFGADFSYTQKPYAKGTYLDSNFAFCQNRFKNSETKFMTLQFRTELKKIQSTIFKMKNKTQLYTSPVLESYGSSLLKWAEKNSFVKNENLFYNEKNFANQKQNLENQYKNENGILLYLKNLEKLKNQNLNELLKNPYFYSILPLIANLRENCPTKNLAELIKLAYNECLRYN